MHALLALDQVDKVVSYGTELHNKNLATFNSAKDQCYTAVETTIKAVLDPTPYVQWATDKVGQYADVDKLVDTSFEVAGKVATFGPGAWLCGRQPVSVTPARLPCAFWLTKTNVSFCLQFPRSWRPQTP